MDGQTSLTDFMNSFNGSTTPDPDSAGGGSASESLTLSVASINDVNSKFFEPLNSSLKLLVAGVDTFFIARIAVNVVLLLRAISDNKKGIIPSKSLLIWRFVYYPIIIVCHIVIMIVTSILLSTYLVDIINAFTEANKAIISYADVSGNIDLSTSDEAANAFATALRNNSSLLDKFAAEFEKIASDPSYNETNMERLMQDEIVLPIIKMSIAAGVFQGIWGITNIVYGIIAKIKVGKAVNA